MEIKQMKKNFYLMVLILFFSCSRNNEIQTPSDSGSNTPNLIQGLKNKFDTKSISSLVLLNKATTLNTGKTAKSTAEQNFFFTDSSGKIADLKIPNAKSYSLNLVSLMDCSKDFILITGTLSVEYLDGSKETYNNFILDKTDGSFYKMSPSSYSIIQNFYARKARSSPWVNAQLQYDDNNSVYLLGENNGIIQEIFKVDFIKISSENIEVKSSTLNFIAESYYFNYYVLPNGDVVYTHKENYGNSVWKLRFVSGKTISISELIQDKPFVINGVTYFKRVDTSSCFGIRSSDNRFILFVKGNEDDNYMGSSNAFIKPFILETENNTVKFTAIDAKTPANINHLNTSFTLFTDYYHGMWYFKSENMHVFTNRGYAGIIKGNIWWAFDDKTNSFKVNFANYSNSEFTSFSQALSSSTEYACVPIGRNINFINFKTLSISTIDNLDFQIFKTQYSRDGVVQFYGISYLSGKKVFGEISSNNSVKILKEFDNNTVEVTDIIKIGNL